MGWVPDTLIPFKDQHFREPPNWRSCFYLTVHSVNTVAGCEEIGVVWAFLGGSGHNYCYGTFVSALDVPHCEYVCFNLTYRKALDNYQTLTAPSQD